MLNRKSSLGSLSARVFASIYRYGSVYLLQWHYAVVLLLKHTK